MKPSDRETAEGILFTDQYQLTMAQVYYRTGLHEQPAQFDHFFRRYPNYNTHQAGYCVSAGLEWFLDWLRQAHFRDEDIEYLRGQRNRTGTRSSPTIFCHGFRKSATSIASPSVLSRRGVSSTLTFPSPLCRVRSLWPSYWRPPSSTTSTTRP